MTFSEHFNLFSTVRAFYITVVFYDPKYRNIHLFRHIRRFFHDHLYKILWRCHDHHTVYRKRLKYCQRNVSCSRRHIYKQIINIAPHNICPKLLHNSRNNRTSPNNGRGFVFQEKIDRHNFCLIFCNTWKNPFFRSSCFLMYSVHFRNRRTCNIRI